MIKASTGRYIAFDTEIGYSLRDFGDPDTQSVYEAQEAVENRKPDLVKQDILEELKELGITSDLMEIEDISFEEFDSNRWHGSGYFSYIVTMPDNKSAKELGILFNKKMG